MVKCFYLCVKHGIYEYENRLHCLTRHSRFISHAYEGVHANHMLKCIFINFMVGNLESQNESVQYVAKLCFTNVPTCSGRNINEIISEYNTDFSLKNVPFCLKYAMDRMYDV